MNFITKHELYSSRDIKEEAKAQLQDNWKQAIFLSLIPALFSIFLIRDVNQNVENISSSFDLINIALRIVQSFLATGVSFTILDFIRNRESIDPLSGVVQAFQGKYFVNLLILKVLQSVYTFLWALLLFIPGIVKSYGYSQAERIFKDKVDQEGIVPSPRECLKESQALMYGHKLDLFTLDLSFLGWIIASVLSMGIGFIWLTPYTEVSQAVFYQNLLGQQTSPRMNQETVTRVKPTEEVGKDPDDFSDFEDF